MIVFLVNEFFYTLHLIEVRAVCKLMLLKMHCSVKLMENILCTRFTFVSLGKNVLVLGLT